MPDIADGESVEIQGSAAKPYILTNTGGVYSCTCPAWRNQSMGIERRTCKHLRKHRGEKAEEERIGGALPERPLKSADDVMGPPVSYWMVDQRKTGWRTSLLGW
jgi:DNA ligase 1